MFTRAHIRIGLICLLLLAACTADDDSPAQPGGPMSPEALAQFMRVPTGTEVRSTAFPAATPAPGQPLSFATLSQRAYVPGSQVQLRLIGPKQAANYTALVQVIGAPTHWRIPITFHNYQATVTLGLPQQFTEGNFRLQIAVQTSEGQTSAPDTAFITLNASVPQPRVDPALVGVWEATATEPGVSQQVQTGSILVFAPEGQLVEGYYYLGCSPNIPGNTCGLRCIGSQDFWTPGTPMIASQGEASGTGAGFRHQIRRDYEYCAGTGPATGAPEPASYEVLNGGQTLKWTWPGAQTITMQRLPS